MPEEANEEVQEEEITLTEDDLAVIDEVDTADDESHEIEQIARIVVVSNYFEV